MAESTESAVKSLLAEVRSDLDELRTFTGGRAEELLGAERELEELVQELPEDVGGGTPGRWVSLDEREQAQRDKKLRLLRNCVRALTLEARAPTPAQKHWLIGYAAVMPLVIVGLLFVCVGFGRVLPELDGWARARGAAASEGEPAPAPAPDDGDGDGAETKPDTEPDESSSGPEDPEADRSSESVEPGANDGSDTAQDPVAPGGPRLGGQQEVAEGAEPAEEPTAGSAPAPAGESDENGTVEESEPSEAPGAGHGTGWAPRRGWVLFAILLLGAAGGCLRMVSSLVLFLGERKLYRSWLPHYYLMPVEGALLAGIVCLLLATGVLNLNGPTAPKPSSVLYLYGIAGFSGLFAKNAMRKLRDLADALFAKPSTTDAAES